MTSNKVILFVILQHFQQSQSYERSLLLCTLESISSHLLLLLLYLRVKLPWTAAFAAVPIICFGFQVCIKFQLGTSCSCNLQRSLWVFIVSLHHNFCLCHCLNMSIRAILYHSMSVNALSLNFSISVSVVYVVVVKN